MFSRGERISVIKMEDKFYSNGKLLDGMIVKYRRDIHEYLLFFEECKKMFNIQTLDYVIGTIENTDKTYFIVKRDSEHGDGSRSERSEPKGESGKYEYEMKKLLTFCYVFSIRVSSNSIFSYNGRPTMFMCKINDDSYISKCYMMDVPYGEVVKMMIYSSPYLNKNLHGHDNKEMLLIFRLSSLLEHIVDKNRSYDKYISEVVNSIRNLLV